MAPPTRTRMRYVRRRRLSRMRRGIRRMFYAFLDAVADALGSTPSNRTFTANATTNILSSTDHEFETGKGPILLESSGTLPAGLAEDTFYWPARIDANTFYLAASREAAAAGDYIDVTDTGTGTHTAFYGTDIEALFERMKNGLKAETLRNAADIDDL